MRPRIVDAASDYIGQAVIDLIQSAIRLVPWVSTIAEAMAGMRTLFSREFIRIQIVDFAGSPGIRFNAPSTPVSPLSGTKLQRLRSFIAMPYRRSTRSNAPCGLWQK